MWDYDHTDYVIEWIEDELTADELEARMTPEDWDQHELNMLINSWS